MFMSLKVLSASALFTAASWAQPPRPPQQKMPESAFEDETGFRPIFDGKTLKDWDGDPSYWRVEAGSITGETLPDKPLTHNSFIIWRGGTTKDFELKLQYRITANGNSGINYRSIELPGTDKWIMQGYQADIDGQDFSGGRPGRIRYTGQNYEERGRTFLTLPGQLSHIEEGKTPGIIGTIIEKGQSERYIKNDDWNDVHILARGNVLVHIFNNQVMAVVIDDDTKGRRFEGELGMQVHVGKPMKVEYRNIRVKTL
jgi:hypothetical protein